MTWLSKKFPSRAVIKPWSRIKRKKSKCQWNAQKLWHVTWKVSEGCSEILAHLVVDLIEDRCCTIRDADGNNECWLHTYLVTGLSDSWYGALKTNRDCRGCYCKYRIAWKPDHVRKKYITVVHVSTQETSTDVCVCDVSRWSDTFVLSRTYAPSCRIIWVQRSNARA